MRHYFFNVTLVRHFTCSYIRYKFYCCAELKKTATNQAIMSNSMDGWEIIVKQIDESNFLQPDEW